VQVKESIRGCDVFLLQPTCPTQTASVNDTLMELMVMVDACRCGASAQKFQLV
jgi:ribose-phosphate pyrophosphokinase